MLTSLILKSFLQNEMKLNNKKMPSAVRLTVSDESAVVWSKLYGFLFLTLVSNLPCFRLCPRQRTALGDMVPRVSSDSVSGLRRSDQSFHFFELLWHRTQCCCILCFCLCLANLPTFKTAPCEKARSCQIYGESRLLAQEEQSPQTWTAVRAQAGTCRCLCIFTHLRWFHNWNTGGWEVTAMLRVKEPGW